MVEMPWWVGVALIVVIVVLTRKVALLMRENKKIRDIVRHLEGVGSTRRKEEEPEELGTGDAEGQS